MKFQNGVKSEFNAVSHYVISNGLAIYKTSNALVNVNPAPTPSLLGHSGAIAPYLTENPRWPCI